MGSKKSSSYLARLFRHTPRKVYIQMFIYQVLNLIACYLYTLSLEGGDLDYLLGKVGYLVSVAVSSLAISMIVAIFNFYTCTGAILVLNYFLQFTSLAYTLTRDLGTDLANHGQYNLLVYCLMLLPIFFAFFLIKLCKFTKRIVKSWKM